MTDAFTKLILHEDACILVLNKPSGLLSVPDRYDAEKPSLVQMATDYAGPEVQNIHRLDKETSGILVFSKTRDSFIRLTEQFRLKQISKKYLAIITPDYPLDTFKVETGIIPSATPGKMMVNPSGKDSLTRFRVLRHYSPEYSLVEAYPETGRTHQIRVHCASLGFPIAGDTLYGTSRSQAVLKPQRALKNSKVMVPRLALHAIEITLLHPQSGKELRIEAPLPSDLQQFVDALGGGLTVTR